LLWDNSTIDVSTSSGTTEVENLPVRDPTLEILTSCIRREACVEGFQTAQIILKFPVMQP
jgi:hypothetical protein